ncbi:MAG: ABC transporter substrate-binding protein [Myxococcota bacterium]
MEKIRLGLEWFLNPDHLPFLIAFQKGWFEDAGLEVEMVEPEEHLDAVAEIEAGEMDLAVTEPLHLVEDACEGKAVVGIARFLHTNGGVMYFEDKGIERPRDMAGARIQYPGAPGPGGPAIVGTMIEADGGEFDPEDFEPVNNGFYHTDALLDGKADVATLAFFNFEVVEARHRGGKAQFFALKDWGIPDFCQLILITSPQLLGQKRDVFSKFLEITQRGLDFAHQHPLEARDIYFQRTETDEDDILMNKIFDATVPCFTFDFSMTDQYYGELQDWMHRKGLIEDTLDADEFWTNDLVFGS